MSIGTPGDHIPHGIEELGSVRVVLGKATLYRDGHDINGLR